VPVTPNNGREPRLLWANVNLLSEFAWGVSGENLYAVIKNGNASDLWRKNISDPRDQKPQQVLTDIRADAVGTALAISPDERWLWFARTDRLALDLMIVPASVNTRN
jgi:hypothetical protein